MIELTRDYVREVFDYRDGNLYWKVRKGQRGKIGDRAGSVKKNGYRYVGINGKQHLAHRLIFLWHHDYLPEFLDHIDRNPSNNNIENLREVTHQENCRNRKKHKSYNNKPTSSRFKGVDWRKHHKKWRASIQINDKLKHLGYFTSEIEAALISDKALIKRDGEFAVTNKSLWLL